MKKLIYIILICSCCIFQLNAQFGVRLGLQSSNLELNGDNITIETDPIASFNVGVLYQQRISDHFFIKPVLSYTVKGAKFQGEQLELSYIDVPMDFVYRFSMSENSFWLSLGPYMSFLMSAKDDDGDLEGYKDTDFGFNLGLGYEIGKFNIGVFGGRTAGTIADDDLDGITVKNAGGALFLSYMF